MTIVAHRTNGRRIAPAPRTLLDDVFGFSPLNSATTGVEIITTDQGFMVEIPVAGFKSHEIKVTLDESILSVTAENQRRKLTRNLIIPDHIDTERIDVVVENGMLTITLAVHPKSQPRTLEVRSNDEG